MQRDIVNDQLESQLETFADDRERARDKTISRVHSRYLNLDINKEGGTKM